MARILVCHNDGRVLLEEYVTPRLLSDEQAALRVLERIASAVDSAAVSEEAEQIAREAARGRPA